jgi:thermitase
MAGLQFYSKGKLVNFRASTLSALAGRASASKGKRGMAAAAAIAAPNLIQTLNKQASRLSTRFNVMSESTLRFMPTENVAETGLLAGIIPTETIIVEGAKKAEINWLKKTFGLTVIQEGSNQKVLLKSPDGGSLGLKQAFDAAQACFRRGNVIAAHPNFLRVINHPAPSAVAVALPWHLRNDGSPGVAGADVHAPAAWTITEGDPTVRIAVLDEGVDTKHTKLKANVVAEYDAVDGNSHARPDGDDAHGTACAGIICSVDAKNRGIAPNCSLVAVRIAKSNSQGNWIFDDFATADAIDWSWDDARADVLSNSWGGGPDVDVITNAFNRARTKGRGNKGAVVVIAAGNNQGPVSYPGSLPDMLTVGASNQWDERKTKTSSDGENWWGSNFGDSLDLVSPGVKIGCTDISGARGYSPGPFTETFNGTSSATPMVAACAGLILSECPNLTESQVRSIINDSADNLTKTGKWNRFVGHGRLNCYAALCAARRI